MNLAEEGMAGELDISGDPNPPAARSPMQVAGEQRKQVNQKRRLGGDLEGGGAGPPQRDSAPPSPATGATQQDTESEPKTEAKSDTPAAVHAPFEAHDSKGLNRFSPVDWALHAVNDPQLAYQTGRRVAQVAGAFLDPGAINKSVQNIYEQDSAQAKLLQAGLTVATGGVGMDQKAAEGRAASATSGVLPITANPINVLGGTNLAANVAIGAGQGILTADGADQQTAALAWAAVTGMILGGSHLPPEARKMLTEHLPGWGKAENTISGLLQAGKQANRNMVDPNYEHAKDWISETLKQGPLEESSRVVAEAGEAKPQIDVTKGEHGELMVKQRSVAQQRASVLRRLGVESVDDLHQRAAQSGFTGKQAKLIAQNWKVLGLPYDLHGVTPGDNALRDPRRALLEIHNAGDDQASAMAQKYLASVHHYLDQIHRGPFGNDGDPLHSVWRALTGVARHDRLIDQGHALSAADVLSKAGVSGEAVSKAIEGDLEAYQGLKPEGQLVVDGFRLITNALRHQSQGTDYAHNFVGNWLPHIDRRGRLGAPGSKRGSTPYAVEARKHRNLAIRTNPQGELVQTQQFSNLGEANTALEASRQRIVEALTNPLAKLPPELLDDPRAGAVRDLLAKDPEAAMQRATEMAHGLRPAKETDFLKILGSGVLSRQMKALHAHQALGMWEKALTSDGKRLAQKISDKNPQRHAESLAQDGYVRPDTPFAGGYMVQKELADLLKRSTTSSGASGVAKAALDLESQAIARIMYFPPIHAMNVAGRLGMMWANHPIATTHYLLTGKALLPHQQDEASYLLRSEAYNSGVLPHSRNLNYAQHLQGAIGSALGDSMHDMEQSWTGRAVHAVGLGKPYEWADQKHSALNHYFWGAVNDFGVMAFHLEKQFAQKSGLSEEAAKLWAARRANTWMGHVVPEDHNPIIHDAMRAIAFAPNWWRTWAELVAPIYRRSGLDAGDPALIKHIAKEQTRMLFSMFAFQKVTGNLMNLMASGHLQNQNLPGNQDRVEVTSPWTDLLPIINQTPREDPQTGGRRTMENPLGRFQRDLEEVAGLQSGHPDWKPQDAADGAAKFTVSRLSPLAEGLGAMFNFDPYHAITTGFQNTKIDRSQPTGLSAMNTFYAALMMSPLGLNLPQQIAHNQQKDATADPVPGPFGTKIPKSVMDSIGNLGGDLEKTLLAWTTGVNPPYDYAAHTRGQQPSDAQYQQYSAAKQHYQSQMNSGSAMALGGQLTPAEWLNGKQGVFAGYKKLHSDYSTISDTTFHNAPSYVHGDEGMLNSYLGLADQTTTPDGSVDYAKLDKLQAQWRQTQDPESLRRMDVLLHANDQRYPMLGLYHKTLDSYRKWQESWAAQHGSDIGSLRQEISEYGALYGKQAESQGYLARHRDLMQYEAAKKREWESSPAGLMYGLFFNSPTVSRYMQAHHLTAQQVEAGAQSAQS